MAYAGAQEETAHQIARAMRFLAAAVTAPSGVSPPDHPPAQPKRRRVRSGSARRCAATSQPMPSGAQAGERILADFQKRIEINYQGGLYPVDFRHAAG